ncbi:class I SAM-dependent methyltransferase [Aureimonas glaciei]|uniref:Class I SAM-dependent methyltransferase n=1 Tax=Aureimonas glaciei TaxID=1776957 RepID=A0A917DAA1_9HYPH|nr:class I SAM-dependent methyltransferase [Aureimonas glaciei]GGD16703.1 hypothetical protein GCM10011335_19420 [Aureimonas glaciei]
MRAFSIIRSNTWSKPDPMASDRSVEFRFRARRFAYIASIIEELLETRTSIRILDVGGTEDYWRIARELLARYRDRISITLVNTEMQNVADTGLFRTLCADACEPDFLAGDHYDLVHSNSVIEHVGDAARMAAFSENIQRLGRRYYVQTPNYWFPLEPHFRVIGFQWLPIALRAWLMRRFNLGFFPRAKTDAEAMSNVAEIRLLNARQMRQLFPRAEQRIERVAGLSKSIMAAG